MASKIIWTFSTPVGASVRIILFLCFNANSFALILMVGKKSANGRFAGTFIFRFKVVVLRRKRAWSSLERMTAKIFINITLCTLTCYYHLIDVNKMIIYTLTYIFTCFFGLINYIGKILPEAVTQQLLEFSCAPAFNTIHFKGILFKCLVQK